LKATEDEVSIRPVSFVLCIWGKQP
jgi:hypothetical protein